MLGTAKSFVRRSFAAAIRIKPLRAAINQATLAMPWAVRRRMHSGFSFSLDGGAPGWKDDVWRVNFAGKTISAPLRASDLAMDWTCAMALLGHDVLEKKSYAALLASIHRPDVFLDVGGNYGLHSLLMMSQGIPSFYFEPNSSCHGYFRAASALNGFEPHIQPVALGATTGSITLQYPKSQTWLGSIQSSVIEALSETDMVSEDVEMRTLDSYLPEIPAGRIVMKIDVEGSEMAVLSASRELLRTRLPIMLFESHQASKERPALLAFLEEAGYRVSLQPWPRAALSREEFLATGEYNFVAMPGQVA